MKRCGANPERKGALLFRSDVGSITGYFDTAPVQLVGVAGSRQVNHLRTLQHRSAVELLNLSHQFAVNGYGSQGSSVNTGDEVGSDVVAEAVIYYCAVRLVFAEAASQIADESVVVFCFQNGYRLRVNRHVVELSAALQFGKELIEFPGEALGFAAVLHIFLADGERQCSLFELAEESLEGRSLCVQAESESEESEESNNVFHSSVYFNFFDVVVCVWRVLLFAPDDYTITNGLPILIFSDFF